MPCEIVALVSGAQVRVRHNKRFHSQDTRVAAQSVERDGSTRQKSIERDGSMNVKSVKRNVCEGKVSSCVSKMALIF